MPFLLQWRNTVLIMRDKMTRRQRILTALNNGIPDRPPISFDVKPGYLVALSML
jgi:hypothetical protein